MLQAAAAYDAAARQIRGDSAICNFPITEKEQENTERYLDRVAASTRKRRHAVGHDCAAPAACLRRLTARQKSRLAGQTGLSVADIEAQADAEVCFLSLSCWYAMCTRHT
jgi:hypothetical protein